MRINQVMTRKVETIAPTATLERAAETMESRNVGLLPVMDGDKVVGVLSDRDLVLRAIARGLNPKSWLVRDVMTNSVLSCREDDTVADACNLMERNLVRRLVVVDENQKLVGIVSLDDLAAKTHSEGLAGQIIAKVSAA